MLRTMLSVGITEDLQISGSLPITLNSGIYMPRGRTMAMMASTQDFEASPDGGSSGARSVPARGSNPRPLSASRPAAAISRRRHAGRALGPVSAASGYASRTHYFWAGGGYQVLWRT